MVAHGKDPAAVGYSVSTKCLSVGTFVCHKSKVDFAVNDNEISSTS